MTYEELKAKLEADFGSRIATAIDPLKDLQKQLADRHAALEREQTELMKRVTEGMRTQPAPDDAKKGINFARFVRALAVGQGNRNAAADWAKTAFGEESPVAKALLAGDLQAGGVLVHPEFSDELIELLRPASVVRSLNPVTAALNNGTLTIPKLTGGATAAYTGESQNITKTEETTGQLVLTARKLAALVPISNDLLRFGATSADAMVRDDLVAALAQRSDLAFIRGTGASNTPKGLRHWVAAANLVAGDTASQATAPTVLQIVEVLSRLRLRLRAADVRFIRPGWLMSPRTEDVLRNAKDDNSNFVFRAEMLLGRLDAMPFRVTTQIPENLGTAATELYLADFADIILAEAQGIVIDASGNAAYHDGSTVQASFSRDETVIRAIALHDFGARHDLSIAVQDDLRWATAP